MENIAAAIDFNLLKKQKEILVELANQTERFTKEEIDALDGVIHLLDGVQDENEFEIEFSVSYDIVSQIQYFGKSGFDNEYYKFNIARHWVELTFDDEEGEIELEYENGKFVIRTMSIQAYSDELEAIYEYIKTKLWL